MSYRNPRIIDDKSGLIVSQAIEKASGTLAQGIAVFGAEEKRREEVLKKDFYATDLVSSWNNNIEDKNPKLFTCGRTCGEIFEFSSRRRGLNE